MTKYNFIRFERETGKVLNDIPCHDWETADKVFFNRFKSDGNKEEMIDSSRGFYVKEKLMVLNMEKFSYAIINPEIHFIDIELSEKNLVLLIKSKETKLKIVK